MFLYFSQPNKLIHSPLTLLFLRLKPLQTLCILVFANILITQFAFSKDQFAKHNIFEKQILSKARQEENQLVRIYLINKLSEFYFNSDHAKAIFYADSALKLAEENNYPNAQIEALLSKADVYERKHYLNIAEEYCKRAFDLLEQYPDKEASSVANSIFANIKADRGIILESLKYNRIALQLRKENKNNKGQLFLLVNIGLNFHALTKYDSCEYYLKEALAIAIKYKNNNGMSLCYQNLGDVYARKKDYQKSNELYHLAGKYAQLEFNRSNYVSSIIGLSENATFQNNTELAINYAEKAYYISLETHEGPLIIFASEILVGLYKINNEYSKSSKMLETINYFTNQILDEERRNAINFNEVLRKENENKILLKEKEKESYLNSLLITVSIVFILIATLAYVFYRREKKYNFSLESKNIHINENANRLEVLNKEIEKSNNQLATIDRVKNRLISTIAHDIRGPLISTNGLVELLLDKSIDEEKFKSYLSQLKNQYDFTIEMVDNLLSWSRSQMGGIELILSPTNILQLVVEVDNLYNQQIKNKRLNLEINIPSDLNILSDHEALKIVLRNILSNAIKYSRVNDEIKIQTIDNGNSIDLIISDTGLGMDQETIGNLFDYKTKSKIGSSNEKGAGIGLILVKEIVDKMNAVLTIESKQGIGTTVKLRFQKA